MWICPHCARAFPALNQTNTYLRITCVCGNRTEIGGDTIAPFVPAGPGTELRKLFHTIGVLEKARCNCSAIATEMDRLGPAGCRQHRGRLLAKIQANSTLYSAWEKACAGISALAQNLPLTLEGLFDLAISRAEDLTPS